MPSIIAYRKFIDSNVTRTLRLPDAADHHALGTELATIGDITYVSLPDGAALPTGQPPEIIDSISEVTLDASLRNEIAAASPHVRLIRERVAAKIAERYTVNDEIKLLRTAPSAEYEVYSHFVEECRDWGRAQKSALGL